jgi:hypothetical protein
MSILLLTSLVAVIAAFAVTGLCLLVAALNRSIQLAVVDPPRFEQRRRPRFGRRSNSALL